MKTFAEGVHPVHMQLQYDMEPDQVDKDGEEAIAQVQKEQEQNQELPYSDSNVQTNNLDQMVDNEQNPEQVLT